LPLADTPLAIADAGIDVRGEVAGKERLTGREQRGKHNDAYECGLAHLPMISHFNSDASAHRQIDPKLDQMEDDLLSARTSLTI
jgi:hypothetical protein